MYFRSSDKFTVQMYNTVNVNTYHLNRDTILRVAKYNRRFWRFIKKFNESLLIHEKDQGQHCFIVHLDSEALINQVIHALENKPKVHACNSSLFYDLWCATSCVLLLLLLSLPHVWHFLSVNYKGCPTPQKSTI